MGFLSVPNLVPWLNIQSLNRHWSVLLDQIPLQLDTEGMKEREDGERGGAGTIIRGRRLCQIFLSKEGGGDYSREAINRGTAVIQGNKVSLIMMMTMMMMMMMMIMLVMIKIVTEARGKSLIIKAY